MFFLFRYSPAPISIKHLLDHGKLSDTRGSFLFLKKEIPTRLANMIMELKLLPEDLRKQRECEQILNDYITSFRYLGSVGFSPPPSFLKPHCN